MVEEWNASRPLGYTAVMAAAPPFDEPDVALFDVRVSKAGEPTLNYGIGLTIGVAGDLAEEWNRMDASER